MTGFGHDAIGFPETLAAPRHDLDRRPVDHVADVGAGGEDLFTAGENDAARGLVVSESREVLGEKLAH